MVMNSPWAMLITPICPKMMARPSPMSSSTANRLRPAKPCIRPMFIISEKVMLQLLRGQRWKTNSGAMGRPLARDTEEGPPRTEGVVPLPRRARGGRRGEGGGGREAPQGVFIDNLGEMDPA